MRAQPLPDGLSMWRFPRPSAFQAADSVLLGLAAAAILAIIVHLARDNTGFLELRVYLLLCGLGLVVGVFALVIGLGRGRDTVDGVFIGPAVRLFAVLWVVSALGMIGLIEKAPIPVTCDDGTVVSSLDDCSALSPTGGRCASAMEALARKLEEAMSLGAYGTLEAGPKGSLLQAAKSVSRTCPREEAEEALDSLRSYRDADPADEPAKTQEELAVADVSFGLQGPVDEDRVVIGQPEPGDPTKVQVTVPDPVIPPAPTPDAGDPDSNDDDRAAREPGEGNGDTKPDQAPQRTVTREYRLGLLPELLNQIVGGIGFGFGGVEITTTEINSALENEDIVQGGQTLADSTAPIETASRAQLYWALIQAVNLDASVGGSDVETIAKALQIDRALGMCFLILSQTTNNENLDFVRNMESTIVNNFAAARHELKDDVASCIDELIRDQATLNDAQKKFTSQMGVFDDG